MNEEQPQKNKVGRPFKMPKWLNELKNVLDETDNEEMLFMTDNDLLRLVNKKLDVDDRIDRRTFSNWKAGKFSPDNEMGNEFLECIEDAFIIQKKQLAKQFLKEGAGNWQKISWIMERKFADEWRTKTYNETLNKNEQSTVIQITAGNEEQKKMIENLINIDYEELKPIIIPKSDVESTTDNKAEEYDF